MRHVLEQSEQLVVYWRLPSPPSSMSVQRSASKMQPRHLASRHVLGHCNSRYPILCSLSVSVFCVQLASHRRARNVVIQDGLSCRTSHPRVEHGTNDSLERDGVLGSGGCLVLPKLRPGDLGGMYISSMPPVVPSTSPSLSQLCNLVSRRRCYFSPQRPSTSRVYCE